MPGGGGGAFVGFMAPSATQTTELDALLEDFKKEPTDDEDAQTRFRLYEAHAENVSTVRQALFKFWDAAKVDVPAGAPKASIEASIASIDGAENLELYINERYWFVVSPFCYTFRTFFSFLECLTILQMHI